MDTSAVDVSPDLFRQVTQRSITASAWGRLLRGQHHIGDFTRWKEHDAYTKALERLLHDLRVEKA
jgi:hypothetical protein